MRRGFTLVEVIVALVILAVVLLGMASTMGGFVRSVGSADRQAAALTAVEDRITAITLHPDYGSLDTAFAGTETSVNGLPGATRTTVITQVGGLGQATNHKNITVTVNGTGLTPVARTITVAAP
jgi:prepilin-type N-terminal cleavage/methylation domain-containing protein